MNLQYTTLLPENMTADHVKLFVDLGYKSAEPDQPNAYDFFEYWVNRMVERPGTTFVVYLHEDNPIACYAIVDVSYGNAYNAECWQKYMHENNLPNGRNIWGVMEYRYVLPEYKGKGIGTAIMDNHHDIMARHTPYTYEFIPSEGYGSSAAEKFHEKYWNKNYNYTLAVFEEFNVKYLKLKND